ncbi:restriction endonuclease subunit S [Myxococcota bacterium]|nr:restriction endonuclease subunit S [Myxococcota bacterium]
MKLEAPEGWRVASLRELGELIKARGGTKKDAAEQGIPVVRYGELYTKHDAVIRRFYSFVAPQASSSYTPLKSGDVLFAGSGETLEDIGRSAAFVGPEPALAGGDLIILRPTTAIDSVFLGYATNAAPFVSQKRRVGQGSSVFHIHADEVAQLVLKVPPHTEQQKIAAVLSSIDAVIEATQAVIDEVQAVKGAAMQALLARGLPGRHAEFKATRVGALPEAWDLRSLAEVAVVQTGIAKGKDVDDGVQLPYLRVANVQDGYVDLTEVKTIEVARDAVERYRLKKGDVLFTEGGDADKLGRGCVWQGQIGVCVHQNHVFAVRVDATRLLPEFLAAWAASDGGKSYFLSCAKQTTNLASINSTQLKNLPVPIPPIEEQREIVAAIESVAERQRTEDRYLAALRECKAALSSVLLTGELRVTPSPAEASP